MKSVLATILLAGMAAATPTGAAVRDSGPAGFTLENSEVVPVDAGVAWRALVHGVDRWWTA